MISSEWRTPEDAVKIVTEDPINVKPGEVGSQTHILTLDEGATPIKIMLQVVIPGTGLIPDITIDPGKDFMSGYPRVELDGKEFNFRRDSIPLEPGVPRKYVLFIGLLPSAPWDSFFVVQVYENTAFPRESPT